ncbi:restriction endonuclease subunit S [Acinetobacter radioresistens]|uniref:restriction endonuclease subunit S n=1 Tax=Acinetobacter radioresistens TaxID=40216 RepID=UPI0035CD1BD0
MATPKLRFDGFSGNWVTTQLGNVCSFTQGVQIPQSEQINEERDGYIRYLYIRDFFSDKFKCYVPNIYPEKIIHPHEIMMVNTGNTTGEAYTGRYGVLSNNSFKISYDLAHFNDQFMYLFCSSELAQNQIKKFFNAGGQPHLGHKNISQILISYPKKEEQTKIASFLSAVNEKISQLMQKHQLLSQYKQGMMQKLFSQQIRFKADDGSEFGEWVNSYIGNECKITTGNKDTQNKVDDGLYPFFVRSQTVEKINSYSMDCEAILTSGDGVGVGKNYHYINGKFDFHQRVYCLYEFSERLVGRYLYIYFSNYFYDRVKRLSAKNSVDSVRMDMISKMEIKLPCLEEQTKIANFLSAIDQKIEVVAQQIEQAKAWKKGLLQQMFV